MKRPTLKRPADRRLNAAIIIRGLLAAAVVCSLFAIIFFSKRPATLRLYEGDISLKDIYAPYDFTYTGEIDELKMKEAEKEALANLIPVYKINPHIEASVIETLSSFFGQVKESREVKEIIGDDKKLRGLGQSSNIKLSDQAYQALLKTQDIGYVEGVVLNSVKRFLKNGILSSSDKESLRKDGVARITVLVPASAAENVKTADEIPTVDDINKNIEGSLAEYFPKDKDLRQAASEIIKTQVYSNIQPSPEDTDKRRELTLGALPKIYKETAVKKNEILIRKGQKVTKNHVKMITQLEKMRDIEVSPFYLLGMGLLILIFLVIFVLHLRFYESRIFKNSRDLILLALLVIFITVSAEAVIMSPLSSYFIPLASVSMLAAILLDAHSAFIVTIAMSVFLGIIGGNNFGLAIVMFVGGTVGIYSVRRVRRRMKLFLGGLLVGIANAFTITALNLVNDVDPRLYLSEGAIGMVNGLFSFMLVIGLLPVLEFLFKIPTDITLLELSDLNHPLLREMATKASGTYHHSLIVGNLAEAACDAIGANSLLSRVGAYYHDIGKLEKTEYFSENESERRNSRHENLAPSMSALVIINHVKDGVGLAHRYKLNQVLIDFITQHHGNGLIYYFYQRALEKAQDEKDIKEEAFRYPGPRPQSKETAIVLLADSVEASSRTLNNPTPSRIEGLVKRIINNKFIDGQLDECNLTLQDLHRISIAFMRILNAMFHTRVEYPNYPKEDEIQKQRQSRDNNNKPDQKADTAGAPDKKDDTQSP